MNAVPQLQVCEGGVLLERIERDGYSEKVVVRIVRSILRFISQCHARGFIYRDVKVRRTYSFEHEICLL